MADQRDRRVVLDAAGRSSTFPNCWGGDRLAPDRDRVAALSSRLRACLPIGCLAALRGADRQASRQTVMWCMFW